VILDILIGALVIVCVDAFRQWLAQHWPEYL